MLTGLAILYLSFTAAKGHFKEQAAQLLDASSCGGASSLHLKLSMFWKQLFCVLVLAGKSNYTISHQPVEVYVSRVKACS